MAEGGVPLKWRWLVAYALGTATAVYFSWSELGNTALNLLARALPLALASSQIRRDPTFALWIWATVSGAVALWMIAGNIHPHFEALPLSVALLAGVSYILRPRTASKPFLMILAVQVYSVAFFSSGHGSADPMIAWLVHHGLSIASAHLVTLSFRKCIHLTFYGIVGWTSFRAALASASPPAEAVRTALLAALSLAAFDELRQSAYTNRTGSAWDVLLDCVGATTFVGLSLLRARRLS